MPTTIAPLLSDPTLLLKDPKEVCVVYHAGCNDGFTAALVLYYLLGPKAWYRAFRYDDPLVLEEFRAKHVVVVDFSFRRPQLLALKEVAASLLVLDHHASAERDLEGLPWCHFQKGISGAHLVLDSFAPALPRSVPLDALRWLVAYTEDRDLWTWGLSDSRAINAALHLWPRTNFALWTRRLSYGIPMLKDRLITEGDALLAQSDQLITFIAKGARARDFMGHTALEVNSTVFWSELGALLSQRAPIAIIWGQQGNGTYRYELRTRREDIDLSALASHHGGGGHPKAAGFISTERV